MADKLISAEALKKTIYEDWGGDPKYYTAYGCKSKKPEEIKAEQDCLMLDRIDKASAIKAYTIEDLRNAFRDGQDNECSYHWGIRKAEPWYMRDEVEE